MNILDNALKYSRSPSKIFVKAEFTKLDNQNFVKIAADQGCGISKEDLPHVKGIIKQMFRSEAQA